MRIDIAAAVVALTSPLKRPQCALLVTLLAAALLPPTTRANDGGCPVRVISSNAHSLSTIGAAAAAAAPASGAQTAAADDEPPTLVTNVRSSGVLSSGLVHSADFIGVDARNTKCQFIFLGATGEHVALVFKSFRLHAGLQSTFSTTTSRNRSEKRPIE